MQTHELAPLQWPIFVQAGGKSSRFGSNKALALLDGEPLLIHVIRSIRSHASSLFVVGETSGQYDALGVQTIPDKQIGLGPLGGLYTALSHLQNLREEWCVLVSCDMPQLQTKWLEQLWQARISQDKISQDKISQDKISNAQAIAFGPEPWDSLFAFYHKSLLPTVEKRLADNQRSMWRLLESIETVAVKHPDDWSQTLSINTPEDLQRYLLKRKS